MHRQLGTVVPPVTGLLATLVEAYITLGWQFALHEEVLGQEGLASGIRFGAVCHPFSKEIW